MTRFKRDQKVLYKGEAYYFGWEAGSDYCTLFEEKGMSGMQDAFAVPIKDVVDFQEVTDLPYLHENFLTEENMRELYRRHQHGSYSQLQKIIIKLVEAVAKEKGWDLDG